MVKPWKSMNSSRHKSRTTSLNEAFEPRSVVPVVPSLGVQYQSYLRITFHHSRSFPSQQSQRDFRDPLPVPVASRNTRAHRTKSLSPDCPLQADQKPPIYCPQLVKNGMRTDGWGWFMVNHGIFKLLIMVDIPMIHISQFCGIFL